MIGCGTKKIISSPKEIVKLYPISENDLWGYSDMNGNIIIDIQFENVNFFSNGLASVQQNGKYGFINKLGQFEIKPKFDTVSQMYFDYAQVGKNGKKYQIDRTGKKLRAKNQKSGIMASCGEPLYATNPLEVFDESIKGFQLKSEYFELQKKYSPQANYKKEDFLFEEVLPFSNTTIMVKQNNLYGFFTHFNHVGLGDVWVDDIQLNYTMTGDKIASMSRCIVALNGKWGLVESMGRFIIDPEYLSLKQVSSVFYFAEYEPDKIGSINFNGQKFF